MAIFFNMTQKNLLDEVLALTHHNNSYSSQLWRDIKEIEFVRQIIEHRNLSTTSS